MTINRIKGLKRCLMGLITLKPFIFGLCWVGSAYAAPVVIYDSGNSLSLIPYFKAIKLQADNQTRYPPATPVPANIPVTASERQQILAKVLPVRTPELTPGLVSPKAIRLPAMLRPVFIIGADRLSVQWFQKHRQQLQGLNAKGLVVNVETQAQLAALKQLLLPLDIVAFSGASYAKQFALSHYPVLISAAGIEQ